MTKENKFELTWLYRGKEITSPVERTENTLHGFTQYRIYFFEKNEKIVVVIFFNEDQEEFYSMDYGSINGAIVRNFELALRQKFNFHLGEINRHQFEIKINSSFNAPVEYFGDNYFCVHLKDHTIYYNSKHEHIINDPTNLSDKIKKIVENYLILNPHVI